MYHIENSKNIPQELKEQNNWVLWKRDRPPGREDATKVLKQANKSNAKSNVSATWTSFDLAVQAYGNNRDFFDGIGFVLDAGFVGIDFDHCYDPETKEIQDPNIAALVKDLPGYKEISPSGDGIKVFIKFPRFLEHKSVENLRGLLNATGPTGFQMKRKGTKGTIAIEVYSKQRYFSVTGNVHEDSSDSIEATDEEIDWAMGLCYEFAKSVDRIRVNPKDANTQKYRINRSDEDVIKVAQNAKNGEKFTKLFYGQWEELPDNFPSQSEADASLSCSLAYWTNKQTDQMSRIFKASALYRPEKGESYINLTMDSANLFQSSIMGLEASKTEASKPYTPIESERTLFYTTQIQEDGSVQNRVASEVADEVMETIGKLDPNEVRVFVMNNQLGRLVTNPAPDDSMRTSFEVLTKESTGPLLNRIGTFVKSVARKFEVKDSILTVAPKAIIEDVLLGQNRSSVPVLKQVIDHPFIDTNGDLINEPGYHEESSRFLPESSIFPVEIMDPREALKLLEDLFGDFDFKDDSDWINALSMLLTFMLRQSFPFGDLPPLFILTSNKSGAGKGTLFRLCAAIILGKDPGSVIPTSSEEEMRKTIATAAKNGDELVFLDNKDSKATVDSVSLCSITGEPTIRVRQLNTNDWIEAANTSTTYILNGKNVDVLEDLGNRAVFIRLDSDEEAAEKEFKDDQILSNVLKDRAKYFSAVYSLIQPWIKAGRPAGEKNHRFKRWVKDLSGIFNHLETLVEEDEDVISKFDQFLNNIEEVTMDNDPEYDEMCRLKDAIVNDRNIGDEWKIGEITRHAEEILESQVHNWGRFPQGTNSRNAAFGRYIRTFRNSTFDGYKLVESDKKTAAKFWTWKKI